MSIAEPTTTTTTTPVIPLTPPAAGTAPLAPKFQTDPNSPFFMASAEWQKVQCYVEAGIKLPISGAEAKTKLNISDADVEHFNQLWAAYKNVHDHCIDFNTNIFPSTVNLAGDIADYGRHKAPTFYGAIRTILNKIESGEMSEARGEAQITAALVNLSADAQARADKAAAAAAQINGFIIRTQEDQGVLTPLKDGYEKELDGTDGRIAQLTKDIQEDKDLIESYNEEYHRDVTIAATSPTYAWALPPLGLIAAAVVAGVYGQRATEALKRVGEFREKLEKDDKELASKLALSHDLKTCDTSVKGILESLTAALPILEKARGTWEAMSHDIKGVLATISSDIKDAPTFIQSLGVDEAIQQWADIAVLADNYRANAYVTVLSMDEVKATLAQDPTAYDLPRAA
jgi:hypothetical protein